MGIDRTAGPEVESPPNTLDVTGVESLAILGNDNVVTWHGKPGGDEPSVADAGSRNKVSEK
jgi:hypothetical protein